MWIYFLLGLIPAAWLRKRYHWGWWKSAIVGMLLVMAVELAIVYGAQLLGYNEICGIKIP